MSTDPFDVPRPEAPAGDRGDGHHGIDAERAAADVVAAEESLLTPRVRGSREALDALLSDDFHEFGISGHSWERDEIIDALVADHDVLDITMTDVTTSVLSDSLVLLTYTTANQGIPRARRTSLWRREGERWRLVHHQGSPFS